MKYGILLLAVFTACTDAPTAPKVHSPYSLSLTLDTKSFTLRGGTSARPLPAYGDTVLIRGKLSNDSDSAWTDTLQVGQSQWMGLTRGLRYMHNVPGLAAGASYSFVDTLVVPLDSTGLREIGYSAQRRGADGYWELVVMHVAEPLRLAMVPAKFTMEAMIMLPETTVVAKNGVPIRAAIVYGRVPTAAQIRITNQLDAPLRPLVFLVCLFDDDYCADWSAASSDMTAVSGKSEALTGITFQVDNDAASWMWYENALTSLRVCVDQTARGAPEWWGPLSPSCQYKYIFLKPRFEAMCTSVPVAPIGVPVQDSDAECKAYHGGSAYKFVANANERYRVTSNAEYAFIVGEKGASAWNDRPAAIDIPSSGTYYVILQHTGPVTFTLTRER